MTQRQQLIAIMNAVPRGCALDAGEPVGDAYEAARAALGKAEMPSEQFAEALGALGILLEQWDAQYEEGQAIDAPAALAATNAVCEALDQFR